MIYRPDYMDALKAFKDKPLVKILTGVRRCGKSTIFQMFKGGFEVTAAAKVKALTQWGCEWAIRREILREFAERGLEIASISGGAAPGQAEVRESEAAAAEPPTEA